MYRSFKRQLIERLIKEGYAFDLDQEFPIVKVYPNTIVFRVILSNGSSVFKSVSCSSSSSDVKYNSIW